MWMESEQASERKSERGRREKREGGGRIGKRDWIPRTCPVDADADAVVVVVVVVVKSGSFKRCKVECRRESTSNV
jgi:hypothetical protein